MQLRAGSIMSWKILWTGGRPEVAIEPKTVAEVHRDILLKLISRRLGKTGGPDRMDNDPATVPAGTTRHLESPKKKSLTTPGPTTRGGGIPCLQLAPGDTSAGRSEAAGNGPKRISPQLVADRWITMPIETSGPAAAAVLPKSRRRTRREPRTSDSVTIRSRREKSKVSLSLWQI